MTVSTPARSDRTANRYRLYETLRDIAVMLAAAAAVALAFGGVRLVQANALNQWPTVPGVITASGIETVAIPGRMIRYVPAVSLAYTYEVDGQTYTATAISQDTVPIPADSAEADRLLSIYQVGTAVMVSINPTDPDDAVLDPTPPIGVFTPGLILLGLAAVAGLMALVVRP